MDHLNFRVFVQNMLDKGAISSDIIGDLQRYFNAKPINNGMLRRITEGGLDNQVDAIIRVAAKHELRVRT